MLSESQELSRETLRVDMKWPLSATWALHIDRDEAIARLCTGGTKTSETYHGQNSELSCYTHAFGSHSDMWVHISSVSQWFYYRFRAMHILCWAMLAIPNVSWLDSHSEHIHSFGCHSITGVWVHISSVSKKQCNKNDGHYKDVYFIIFCTS